MDQHFYFTHPDFFYQTIVKSYQIDNCNLLIEEIQDLDQCIDFQCAFIEKNPFPSKNQGILEDYCPYFAVVWESALNLSWWCKLNIDIFKGKNVLEIGAGLAVPSLILSLNSINVTATDYHPHSSFFAKKNSQLNSVHLNFLQSSWKDLLYSHNTYDYILASDVLYEGKYTDNLLELIDHLLQNQGEFILCDPVRGYLQNFLSKAEKFYNLKSEIINYIGKEHFLIRLKKKVL